MGKKGKSKGNEVKRSRRDFLGKAGLGLMTMAGVTLLGSEKLLYANRDRRKKLILGGVFSLTGTFERVGNLQLDTWTEWAQMVNDAGGCCPRGNRRRKRRRVELVVKDDESSPDVAKLEYEKLIRLDKVDLLTRPWLPGREDIEQMITELGVPMLGFTSGISDSETRLIPRLVDSIIMNIRDTQQPRQPSGIEGEIRDGNSRSTVCASGNFSCAGGWFDDYECTQEFTCLNTFNCTYSFDQEEDCESSFACGAKFEAEGCTQYGCPSMYSKY